MFIDHKVSFPEILYDFLTIDQYDTGSKAHIASFLTILKAQMLSYYSSVSCKSRMSLVCNMKVKEAEYESKVIGGSKWNEYNVIEWQE